MRLASPAAFAGMFREGIDGFKGGVSAENYIAQSNNPGQPRQGICTAPLQKAR
jgi:hypothetical protein